MSSSILAPEPGVVGGFKIGVFCCQTGVAVSVSGRVVRISGVVEHSRTRESIVRRDKSAGRCGGSGSIFLGVWSGNRRSCAVSFVGQ